MGDHQDPVAAAIVGPTFRLGFALMYVGAGSRWRGLGERGWLALLSRCVTVLGGHGAQGVWIPLGRRLTDRRVAERGSLLLRCRALPSPTEWAKAGATNLCDPAGQLMHQDQSASTRRWLRSPTTSTSWSWSERSRLIARRTKLTDGDQQSFADHDGYRLSVFLTNQPGESHPAAGP